MSDQLQFRRGTTLQTAAFTGAQGEVTVDTDKHVVVIHDGVTEGGFPQINELTVDKRVFLFDDDAAGGSVADAYILAPQTDTIRPDEYVDGMHFSFITANANTGAATANFSELGVKDIKKPDGSDPAAGEIEDRVTVIYDADNDWLELQLFQPFDEKTAKTDVPQVYTEKQTVSGSHALTSSTNSVAVDLSYQYYTLDMTEDTTLAAPSNVTARQVFSIEITQDDTTAYTLGYNTFYQFAGGSAPAISATLESKSRLVCEVSEDGTYAACNLLTNIGNS
jgi:hypothetical protein